MMGSVTVSGWSSPEVISEDLHTEANSKIGYDTRLVGT